MIRFFWAIAHCCGCLVNKRISAFRNLRFHLAWDSRLIFCGTILSGYFTGAHLRLCFVGEHVSTDPISTIMQYSICTAICAILSQVKSEQPECIQFVALFQSFFQIFSFLEKKKNIYSPSISTLITSN